MLSGATSSACETTGTAVFRIVVSSDSMKNATATSQGRNCLAEPDGEGEDLVMPRVSQAGCGPPLYSSSEPGAWDRRIHDRPCQMHQSLKLNRTIPLGLERSSSTHRISSRSTPGMGVKAVLGCVAATAKSALWAGR